MQSTFPDHIDIIEMSRYLITQYYQRDFDWVPTLCAPNITFVGTSQEESAVGIDEFGHCLETVVGKRYPGLIGAIDLQTASSPSDAITVVTAKFLAATNPLTGHVLAAQKRMTLVWDTTSKPPVVLHLHISSPSDIAHLNDAAASHSAMRETYRYTKVILDQVIKSQAIPIRDVRGSTHFLAAVEVRYLEARRQQTIVHCLEDTVVTRRSFKDLLAAFDGDLMGIHRSFAINPLHVRAIRLDSVLLDDGTEVPLPQRRARQVREQLEQVIAQLEPSKQMKPEPLPPPVAMSLEG